MLFKQTQTKLILDTTELQTLEDAYNVLTQLIMDMAEDNFSEVITDDFPIGYDTLKDTSSVLYMLVHSNILEVE